MNRNVRNRLWSLLLVLCLVCGLLPGGAAAAESEGTAVEIGTAEELLALFEAEEYPNICDQDFILTADIDMAGQTVSPIGSFDDAEAAVAYTGTFDGNGYAIQNLTVSGGSHCVGLFAYVGTEGTVKNLTLENITVSGSGCNNVGAVAGCLTGTVSRCHVTGSVTGKKNVGGVAGILHAGTIENCLVDVDVQASGSAAGGLFGDANYNGRNQKYNGSPLFARIKGEMNLVNNLILGSVSGSTAGGMLGDFGNSLTSDLGDFVGNVVWAESITSAGAYGYAYAHWTEATSRSVKSENVYCIPAVLSVPEGTKPTQRAHVNFTERTAAQLGAQLTYEDLGWDFDRVWLWDKELGHPVLRDVKDPVPADLGPLYIGTAEELAALFEADFEENRNREIYLTADIDMAGYDAFAPLGVDETGYATAFNGTFDGQGHVIKNLKIQGINGVHNSTGFIGYVGTRGTVTRLGLEDITVSGRYFTGGLAGCLTGTVTECYLTGQVTGRSNVGGLAGILHAGTIENCWVDADVTATSNMAGGLFGTTNYSNNAENSFKSPLTGILSAANEVVNTLVLGTVTAGKHYAGGMLGNMSGATYGCALQSFTGNVVWVETVTAGTGNYGSVFGYWSKARTIGDENYQNFYYSGMELSGGEGTTALSLEAWQGNFSAKSASALGKQATYESKKDGLSWDFTNVWVWSTKLGHPVLRGVTAPGGADALDQKTPASLVTTFADDPKTTRAFTWYTDTGVTGTVVEAVPAERYAEAGEAAFDSADVLRAEGACSELQTDAHGSKRNIHKVNLTGLEAGTSYCYRAGDGEGSWSPVYTFTTEAEDSDSFTFFSMTDTQANYKNYAKVLEDAVASYPEAEFILHGGDVIQNNSTPDYDSVFALTQEYAAYLPTMVTPGNHELAKDNLDYVDGLVNYNSHFQFPDNGPDGSSQAVYSFDYGDAHIAVLDSNRTVDYTAQLNWLREDMAATDKAWKIVSIHAGPYNNYGRGNKSVISAMDELGIDLVFFGHNHAFLRSNSIKDGVTDASQARYEFLSSEGTIYYSSGCAGGNAGKGGGSDASATSPEKMASTYFPVRDYPSPRTPTYGAITVTEDTLTVRSHSVSMSGAESRVIDEFVITKPVASYTAPTVQESLIYNGEEQPLVEAGSTEDGTMLYSLDGETYSEEIPAATDAGTYTVWYKVAGDKDHSDSEPQSFSVTIAPRDIADAVITLGEELTYNGRKQTQTIESVVVDGLTVTYEVSGNTGTKVRDDYVLTVTGTGNFTGTATAVWSILRPYDIENMVVEDGKEEQEEQVKPPFADVAEDAYYSDAVLWAVENGITSGTGAGLFSPDAVCTRAQAVTFLWRAAGSPEPGTADCPFADVAPEAYYYDAVLWAVEKGITVGTSADTFSPDLTVTRAQTVTFLWRWAQCPAAEGPNAFADVAEPDYYYGAVLWAVEQGITTGTAPDAFSPDAFCLRSQIVTFLWRFLAE